MMAALVNYLHRSLLAEMEILVIGGGYIPGLGVYSVPNNTIVPIELDLSLSPYEHKT